MAAASAVLGTALAWLVARTDLPGRRTARLLLPLPLVMPSFIAAFALLAAFAPGGLLEGLLEPLGVEVPAVEGFWGALYVLTLFTYPYVYLPVVARLGQLPASLEESARLLGRGPAAVFRTVVAPQAAGAVWAGTLLVFLYTISDFGAVQLLRYETLTSSIYASRVFDRAGALAQSLLLGLLAVAVVAAERSVTRGGGPGRLAAGARSLRVPLGRWRGRPALVAGSSAWPWWPRWGCWPSGPAGGWWPARPGPGRWSATPAGWPCRRSTPPPWPCSRQSSPWPPCSRWPT